MCSCKPPNSTRLLYVAQNIIGRYKPFAVMKTTTVSRKEKRRNNLVLFLWFAVVLHVSRAVLYWYNIYMSAHTTKQSLAGPLLLVCLLLLWVVSVCIGRFVN